MSACRCPAQRLDQYERLIAVTPGVEHSALLLTPKELAAFRRRFVEAIRAYNAEGKPARRYPIQFLIRRTAQHVLDHAWEMEDRDLSST